MTTDKVPQGVEKMVAYNSLPYFVQGLVDPHTWGDPSLYNSWVSPGSPLTMRFNFAETANDGETNFMVFTEAQKASVRLALQQWSSVAGLSLLEVGSDEPAVITFYRDDLTSVGNGGAAGYAYMPSIWFESAGDVHISSLLYSDTDTFAPGNYAFQVLLHEIGHSLGLKHPFEAMTVPFDSPALPSAEDTQTNTVMTYNFEYESATSIGFFDLAAVHALYGVNHAARSGSNVYSLADRYIWDGAGVDVIDGSGETARLNIKLAEGSWIWAGAQSSSILDDGQAFIGYGTVIERAKGGSAADFLQGNGADNVLLGNAGFDALWGMNGADTLFGGTGNDRLFGGNGHDSLNGANGNDSLIGGRGLDLLVGGAGNDTLVGGLGKDTLVGGAGQDIFKFLTLLEAGVGAGRDVITDFVAGKDQIDLHLLDANAALTGDQAFSFVGNAAFSGVAGELRFAASLHLLAGDTNGDGVADFQIELTGVSAITAQDILA